MEAAVVGGRVITAISSAGLIPPCTNYNYTSMIATIFIASYTAKRQAISVFTNYCVTFTNRNPANSWRNTHIRRCDWIR